MKVTESKVIKRLFARASDTDKRWRCRNVSRRFRKWRNYLKFIKWAEYAELLNLKLQDTEHLKNSLANLNVDAMLHIAHLATCKLRILSDVLSIRIYAHWSLKRTTFVLYVLRMREAGMRTLVCAQTSVYIRVKLKLMELH